MLGLGRAAVVLAVSLFHVGVGQGCGGASSLTVSCWVSRAQPVHASANKVKAEASRVGQKEKLEKVEYEGPAECSECLATLRKQRQRDKVKRKDSISEDTIPCYFRAR